MFLDENNYASRPPRLPVHHAPRRGVMPLSVLLALGVAFSLAAQVAKPLSGWTAPDTRAIHASAR